MKNIINLFITVILILPLGCSEKPYTIPYEPGVATEKEIENLLNIFMSSIESDENLSIYQIESCFAQYYEASADTATQEIVKLGLIPSDYLDISPTYVKLFRDYEDIQIDPLDEPEITVMGNEAECVISFTASATPVSESQEISSLHLSIKNNFRLRTLGGGWKIIEWTILERMFPQHSKANRSPDKGLSYIFI